MTARRKQRSAKAAKSGRTGARAKGALRSAKPKRTPTRKPAKRAGAARSRKRVYFFGAGKAEGRGDQKELLGGKGAGLAEMTRLGVPVPPGFTISTEVCAEYDKEGGIPAAAKREALAALARIE